MNKHKPDVDKPKEEIEIPLWELDGVTHINTHFKQAKKELGKMLAHYSVYRFKHDWFGPFKSMEGFWCYIRGGCNDDRFRSLNGHRARALMMELIQQGKYTISRIEPSELNKIMLLANYAKIDQNLVIKETLIESTLPFDHYYVHGPGKIIIRPRGSDDLNNMYEELRTMFKEGRTPEPYDYSKVPIIK